MAIRVLRIVNRMIIGGPIFNVSYLSKYLAPDFETVLVSGQKEEAEEDSEFIAKNLGLIPLHVESMKKSLTEPWNDIAAYKEIKKIIKEFKPHIVHTHAAKAGFVGRLAALHCNVPVILHTFHGHYFHSYFSKFKTNTLLNIERYLAKKTDGIIAISPEQVTDLSSIYKVTKPSKTFLVPLGLDLEKFSQNAEAKRQAFRQEFAIDDDTICVGIIGRIVPVKNHGFFNQVAKNVLDAGLKTKVKFFIIGDGENRLDIEKNIQDLGIAYTNEHQKDSSKDIIFTSWRKDMDAVLAGLDIIALTSLNEGTPVTLIEAQASKKAIVSTNVGGINFVVDANKSAYLVDKTDIDGFTEKLIQLIESPTLRLQMGECGYNHVIQQFSVHRLVNDTKNLYYKLLQDKGISI